MKLAKFRLPSGKVSVGLYENESIRPLAMTGGQYQSLTDILEAGNIDDTVKLLIDESAEPLTLVAARLPCLATGTPAAAVTMAAAVLTLNVCEASPPVPHVSTRPVRSVVMGRMCRRMAAAAPAISATVSPFIARPVRKSPISSGRHWPCMISEIVSVMVSRVRSSPAARLPIAASITLESLPPRGAGVGGQPRRKVAA